MAFNHRVVASYFDILLAISGQFHSDARRLLIYAEKPANLPQNALLDVQQLYAFCGDPARGPLGADMPRRN